MPQKPDLFNPTPELETFLSAEVRNEADGGDETTTLGSAMDSLYQMPPHALNDLNPVLAHADRHALILELQSLIDVFGNDFEIAEHINPEAGARTSTP